ncbi:MAG: hypothetical protein LQ340_003409 [Diploschistes diacapsis]|nr:MAG: hypothetical protein LQ340_003409 [Diploschistes diacapsis]
MSWLKQISSSLFTASNENTLALANLKFDFALLKVEAPKEFSPLGSALCERRKTEAEDGNSHKTARKLGALFEQMIPNTPKLISAYGQRVSEIMDMPGVNPEGLSSHGPFRTYVGADATALWAAATSGIPALAMYLLASQLASEWDHKEAVSIWVELVAERKKEIMDGCHENHMITESSLFSSRQDISRNELSAWDTSARSWIRSANQAKRKEVDQFLLILKNQTIDHLSGTGTYEKLLNRWREAMNGMEHLLCGRPQSIVERSIPSAILSWHLFPDLIVLNKQVTNVPFRDKLLPQSGTCTMGSVSSVKEVVSHWSLTLSHFQFYGPPVKVTSQEQFSRVNIHQFLVVTFGSLLGAWKIHRSDVLMTAWWFETLWTVLKTSPFQPRRTHWLKGFEWLHCLVEAARLVIKSEGSGDKGIAQLLEFGMRRAKNFLCDKPFDIIPFFGLCNPYVLSGLTQSSDVECSIRFMREIAHGLQLDSSQAVIMLVHNHVSCGCSSTEPQYYEFVSVAESDQNSNKRSAHGERVSIRSHVHWLSVEMRAVMPDAGLLSGSTSLPESLPVIASRIANIHRLGERVLHAWYNDPMQNLAWDVWHQATMKDPSQFKCIIGDQFWGLWAKREATASWVPSVPNDSLVKSLVLKTNLRGTPNSPNIQTVAPGRLYDYLYFITTSKETVVAVHNEAQLWAPGVSFLARHFSLPPFCIRSLHAIAMARLIYSYLEDATISLKLVTKDSPIAHAQWSYANYSQEILVGYQGPEHGEAEDDHKKKYSDPSALRPNLLAPVQIMYTRQQTFACLAHLETGYVDLHPNGLDLALALSIENSIYVAGVVLSDPYEKVPGYRLKRLTGNIGRDGISILIAPKNPQVREPSECYNLVEHKTYDLQREDNFKATSMHLQFTEWTMPLDPTSTRTIDQDVFFVESVISVLDRGKWVADLDILSIQFSDLIRVDSRPCTTPGHGKTVYEYRCLDSWEELLDPPDSVKLFRAHGNWAARLAAVSILTQCGKAHCIAMFGPNDFCLTCLEDYNLLTGFKDVESALPSFCID